MSGTMSREEEGHRLRCLRAREDRMRDDEWVLDTDGRNHHLWVRRYSGEQVHVCTIHAEALEDERELIGHALGNIRFLLSLVERASQRIRALQGEEHRREAKARAENFGFLAKSLCETRAFWRFLEEKGPGGPVGSATAAETRLKGILAIQSKAELNSDSAKRQGFLDLRGEFQAWRRGER